jgi:hypothetical protein
MNISLIPGFWIMNDFVLFVPDTYLERGVSASLLKTLKRITMVTPFDSRNRGLSP